MLTIILVLLILFWLIGYVPTFNFDFPLFVLNGHAITLTNLIVFALIAWMIGILPSPFREIAMVLLILWVLSLLGIIVIGGLSNILVAVIIIGLILYLLGFRF